VREPARDGTQCFLMGMEIPTKLNLEMVWWATIAETQVVGKIQFGVSPLIPRKDGSFVTQFELIRLICLQMNENRINERSDSKCSHYFYV